MTERPKRRALWTVAMLLLALACVGATYLLYVSLKNGPVAGCGKGSSCDLVLASRWSYLLPGVPVTAPALFTYMALLFGLLFKSDSKVWEGVFLVGSFMVIGAAIWFIGLQAFVVKAFCKYCMATHVLGVGASICILLGLRPIQRELLPLGVGAAAMGLAMMAGAQIILPQKSTRDTRLAAGVAGRGGEITVVGSTIDIGQFPHSGNTDAGKIMILSFDYTCGFCRRMHGYLSRAEERFGKENYLVVLLPTPLNPDCNRHFQQRSPNHRNACEFASTALALWSIDPEKFYEFDRWMIETGSPRFPPDREAAKAKAVALVGEEALATGLKDPSIAERIEKTSEIWNKLTGLNGSQTMPKIIWSSGAMSQGATSSEFGLFELKEKNLGLVRSN